MVINQVKAYTPLARPHPRRSHPRPGPDRADDAPGHLGDRPTRPAGPVRDALRDSQPEPAHTRTGGHHPRAGQPAGASPAGDHRDQHVSAAVLLAEIGYITRFTDSAKLARYTGCAPIPVYSSDKERHRLHRGGNRRLNSVLYTAAIVQQRFHPGARDLLARHEPTKGGRGARRILKRHLIDVIHRAMLRDRASWHHHVTEHRLAA
ncbi:transposase [Kitasatospora sp. NPDC059648]|uniref:transposase n=1 Tax=Kitasatospora sp. NPDC059648 TaxID=3346894 RepID=UPI003678BC1D